MNWLNRWYLKLRESEKGQTMAEYGLILAAVAVAAIVAYQGLGSSIISLINKVGQDLS